MKIYVALPLALTLAACGGASDIDQQADETAVDGAEESAAAEPEEFALPLDLPMAPNTRLVGGNSFDVGTIRESIASLATTGEGKAALDFYEQELVKQGFETYSRGSNPDKPRFAAKKDNMRIQASLFGSGDGLEEGETDVRLIFKIPN